MLVTNDELLPAEHVLEWHLQHADVENLIKEHKHGYSLEKLPPELSCELGLSADGPTGFHSGRLVQDTDLAAGVSPGDGQDYPASVLNVAGKIVRTAHQFFLVISHEYRYKDVGRFALARLAQLKFE